MRIGEGNAIHGLRKGSDSSNSGGSFIGRHEDFKPHKSNTLLPPTKAKHESASRSNSNLSVNPT